MDEFEVKNLLNHIAIKVSLECELKIQEIVFGEPEQDKAGNYCIVELKNYSDLEEALLKTNQFIKG